MLPARSSRSAPVLLLASLALAACDDGGGGSNDREDAAPDVLDVAEDVEEDPAEDPAVETDEGTRPDVPDARDVAEDTLADVPDDLADAPVDTPADAPADAADVPEIDVDIGSADAPLDLGPMADEFTAVDLAGDAAPTLRIATRACAGLYNRELGGSVIVRFDQHDQRWLDEFNLEPTEVVSAEDFVEACVAEVGSCVRYSYADQQALLPPILTVAAAEGAVPLDAAMDVACDDVAFDATVEFAERNTRYLATQYAYENHLDRTTGLAWLNPGYSTAEGLLSGAPLDGGPRTTMIDFVFSERLFVVFLLDGCVAGRPENELLQAIVDESGWSTPIGVYGYNNSWNVGGGYLNEAQTRCLDSRNMGAIPTETGNLSFWSTRRAPIRSVDELERNPPADLEYDPDTTYVAFVIGDGDNIRFMMTWRTDWLNQRLADCASEDDACAPLSWSMSPHLSWIAPDILGWYYEALAETGNDTFTLPPSGHQYAYPSSLNRTDQYRFVAHTERAARLLGTIGTVHWEWFDSWRAAEDEFLPKYATADGPIRGIFPVNVPYPLEAFPWWGADEFYRVLSGADGTRMVVFRPRQWRGVSGTDNPAQAEFFVSPDEMADELGGYPPGTVTVIYMTSDGGLSLENSFMELVRILPDHVEVVSADNATRLALAAAAPAD